MSAAMVLPCSTPTLSNAGPNPHASESEGHAAYAARLKTELEITAAFKPPAQERAVEGEGEVRPGGWPAVEPPQRRGLDFQRRRACHVGSERLGISLFARVRQRQ